MIRATAKKMLPDSTKKMLRAFMSWAELCSLGVYDFRRYVKLSGAVGAKQTLSQTDAHITRIYHAIEKGLSLPHPRPGFGESVVVKLVKLLEERLNEEGPWTIACENGVNALTSYRDHAFAASARIPSGVDDVLLLAAKRGKPPSASATREIKREDIIRATQFDPELFFWTRHSVRQFSERRLTSAEILKAIDLARSSPSVCNRQSGRVHLFMNNGSELSFLRHQNGNRGFGDTASAILVITADLNAFIEPTERYQSWIDGGMFSMSIALACHALGYGACCLNWSARKSADLALRKAAGIPDHETIIMLMAVGALRESFKVAKSERLPLDQITRVIG